MDFSKLNLKSLSGVKLAVFVLIVLVFVSVLGRFIGSSVAPFLIGRNEAVSLMSAPSYGYDGGVSSGKVAFDRQEESMPQLSARNVASPMPPMSGGTVGNQAEAFEAKEYTGTIRTRTLEETCGTIAGLKARTYVIFENTTHGDEWCNFSFKVERNRLEEVLAIVKGLDPKDLSEHTYTIKRTIDDFTSEVEILEKKQTTIEKTLEDATKAYEEITTLASRTQDVASLARIIESKLQIVERLTQERIQVSEQLDRLARGKAEQLDRLDYAYFHLTVQEDTFVNGEQLKDSWKFAIREFVRDVNGIAQDLTVGLMALVFFAAQWLLYGFLALVIVKYAWKFTKAFWKS